MLKKHTKTSFTIQHGKGTFIVRLSKTEYKITLSACVRVRARASARTRTHKYTYYAHCI